MTTNDHAPGADLSGPVPVVLSELDLSEPLRGLNAEHVALLAEVLDQCEPLLVHCDTARVIDGHHRAAAAAARGDRSIAVQWVRGDEAELLEVALRANTAHGLPLTREQRRQGVDRLIQLRPAWSNRRIADAAGVSDATVRRRRQARAARAAVRPPSPMSHLDGRRTRRDGKNYPSRGVALVEVLQSNPGASDRQIARLAGCSPTTVAAWRRRHTLEATDRPTSGTAPHKPLARAVQKMLAWILDYVRRACQGGGHGAASQVSIP
ncbi:MAG: hypothetical protein ACTHOK_07390 [Nocardioidaceae bacterium]